MASYQFFNHSTSQVRNFYSGQVFHGRSKTLMCLHKILRVISTFSPPESPKEESLSPVFDESGTSSVFVKSEDCKGLPDVDLNIPVGSPPLPPQDAEQSKSPKAIGCPSACSGAGGEVHEIDSPAVSAGFSAVECDLKKSTKLYDCYSPEIEGGCFVEKEVEVAETSAVEVQQMEVNENGVSAKTTAEKQRSHGCLDLLIEAAKFISGDFKDCQPSPHREFSPESCRDETRSARQIETAIADESAENKPKRRRPNQCWMVDLYGDFEDVSPVVRSKRGRSQVLPYKYRDSVLEPLKPLSRHRSATVSSKRRSR